MSKITSNLIKNNLCSILNEFPNAFIRPCNSNEFLKKPSDMKTSTWNTLSFEEKKMYMPEPSHQRKNHSYAHICITQIEDNKSTYKRYKPEQFFYVTSSTYFTDDHKIYIAFRQNLIEDWTSGNIGGFANIMWFPKNASFNSSYNNKWAIIDHKELEASYINSIKEKTLIPFKNNGYMYFAFPILNIELKNKAINFPEKSVFNPKYANTFDFIENIQYKNSRRCRKGILYCAIIDNNKNIIKETTFRSEREAWQVLSAFYGFEYSQKTFQRNINREMIQKMIPLYEDYTMFLTYNQEQLEEFKKNPEMFYTKKEEKIEINDVELTRTEIVPIERNHEKDAFYNIIDEIIEMDKEESNDDFLLIDSEVDHTDNSINMTEIQKLKKISHYDISKITDSETFIYKWEIERKKYESIMKEKE